MLFQANLEAREPLMGGPEAVRAVDVGDPLVTEAGKVPGRLRCAARVLRAHHAGGLVERDGGDPHVRAADRAQHVGDVFVLRDGRGQDHARRLLLLHEGPQAFEEVGLVPVAGAQDELKAAVAERVEDAALHVHDVLGTGVVVDQPDEEGPAEGERPGLGVRRVALLADHRLDACPGLVADERRLVDDAGDRLLRDAGQPGDVVDGDGAVASELAFVGHDPPSPSGPAPP